MTEDLKELLSELDEGQLKELAENKEIDCSKCEKKEDLIAAISESEKVTSEDVKALMEKEPAKTPSSEEQPMPDFSEAEKLLIETKRIFDSGDYLNTISKATEAIDMSSKALNSVYGIGLSYAIRSSENMISDVKNMDLDASNAEEILKEAQEIFENQDFSEAVSIMGDLRSKMGDLEDQMAEKITDFMETVQSRIDNAKALDADVSSAQSKLDEAKKLMESDSRLSALNSVRQAENLAKAAYDSKVQNVSDVIAKAESAIEEAKFLNAQASEAEDFLESARKSFDDKDYVQAIENANSAISSAHQSRDEQIQKAISIREKLKEGTAPTAAAETPVAEEQAAGDEVAKVAQEQATEEKEAKVEEPVLKPKKEEKKYCPKCGGDASYVEQYDRYYCYTCSVYIEPVDKVAVKAKEPEAAKAPVAAKAKEEAAKVCPKCGGDPTYVDQYQRYYCYTCSEYIEPVQKKVAVKPKEPTCPDCATKGTYIEQYNRYYCYTCSKYIET
ncbi:MAG: hypothetical protein JSW28_09755 [Thermoplasmata archaeon]|nr:MAG: hypothetical protein JSW28_09755 [Thermoplasmata archaeon]